MNAAVEQHKDIRKVIADESLDIFIDAMREFNQSFCDSMGTGKDFTLKLEIHGNKGKMLHCRVNSDKFARPKATASNDDRKKIGG